MQPTASHSAGLCERCKQPVPANAARCPHCGERMPGIRSVSRMMGIIGAILGLIIVAGLVYLVSRGLDESSAPPPPANEAPAKPPLN
jgi:hypothetical protein